MPGAVSTLEVARLVRAPVDHVWRQFTDIPARDRTMSTVDSVELLSGREFRVGTRWRETRTVFHGEPVTEELRVVSAEPPYRCLIDSHGPGEDYRLGLELTPRHGHTRARLHFETALPERFTTRVLTAFFGGIVLRSIEGVLRQDLEDLAAAVEAAAA
ncbi:MAG: SRPBCC family protein [Micromonosporaceae bacterium]